MFPQKMLRLLFFLLRRTWDFEYDFTVTSAMTSTTDLSPKEELQGATCTWPPFVLLLIVAKQNLPLDSQLLEVSKGHGGPVPPHCGQGMLIYC